LRIDAELKFRPDEAILSFKINNLIQLNRLDPDGGGGAEPVAAGAGSGSLAGRTKFEMLGGGAIIERQGNSAYQRSGGLSSGAPNGRAWRTLTTQAEYSTAAEEIRLSDCRWVFVFSGFTWRRGV
jgi:hypothetical protein